MADDKVLFQATIIRTKDGIECIQKVDPQQLNEAALSLGKTLNEMRTFCHNALFNAQTFRNARNGG